MMPRRYRRLLADVHGLVALSLAVSVAQSALLVPIPLIVKNLFDVQLDQGDAGGVVLSGLLVLALYLSSALLGLWTRHTALKAIKRAMARLRAALLAKINALPRAFFDRRSVGELHGIVVQDSERLDLVANAVLGTLLPAIVIATGLAVVGLVINPVLFALLAVVLPGTVIVSRLLKRGVRERTREWQRAFDGFSEHTRLALRAVTLTKVSGAEDSERERARLRIEKVREAGFRMNWRQATWGIAQGLIATVAGVLVLVVGGREVALGQMSLGELLSFFAIVALLQRQMTAVAPLLPQVTAANESLARIEELLDTEEPPPPYSGTRRIDFGGEIGIEEVVFGYGDEVLLRQIDLSVEAGEHIAIVGPNGAGKSTLASLILGLYRPWSGRFLADGIPYDELDLRHLRREIGVVLQDPIILPGTVGENIAYGHPEATGEEIAQAAERAAASEFIAELDGGYDAPTGDEGGLLSGGQRQRLAIARALLAEPRLLIFDEPTTHLDDRGIQSLNQTLRELAGSPTVITITHDEAAARGVDRVIQLRDGRIAAQSREVERPVVPISHSQEL